MKKYISILMLAAAVLRLSAQIEVVSGGKVGIGTSSPNKILEIMAADSSNTIPGSANTALRIVNNTSTGNSLTEIQFANNQVTNSRYAAISGVYTNGLNNTQGDIIFSTRNASSDANLTERVRILSGGNVGIGITSPSYKLDVNGAIKATDFIGTVGATAPNTGTFTILAANNSINQSVSNNGVSRNLMLRNTSSGSSAYSILDVGNDVTATLFEIAVTSSSNSSLGGTNSATLFTGGPYKLCLGYNGGIALTISSAGSTGMRFNGYGAGTLTTDSSGNITATSDARAKVTVADFTTGLAALRQLQPKKYHWKKETGLNTADLNVSVYAQDLLAAGIPEAVFTQRTVEDTEEVAANGLTQKKQKLDANGEPVLKKVEAAYYTVSDRTIISVLINAVKELAAKNEALEARLAKLESK